MQINIVKLENDKEYGIIATLVIKNNRYVFLQSVSDAEDLCVRKVITENDKDYMVKLDSKEEFAEVMKEYYEKNRKEEK